MKAIGILFIIIGALLGIHALTMDVTVAVDYSGSNSLGLPERVNNIGLMSDRQNYLIFGGILLVIGLILTIFYNKGKKQLQKQNYREFQDLAKRAEYKGQISTAIDHYMDTLFHLENDYKNLPKRNEVRRLQLIETIKAKVEELKMRQQNELIMPNE